MSANDMFPPVVDRETWLKERTVLLAREKAHTREGDAIAAARRRLPMTEVDPVELTGPNGATSLLDLFQGHDELIVYKHMFHTGRPFEAQCEGCTLSIWHAHDTAYLDVRGIAFAIVAEGPWSEVEPFVDFMGYTVPWYSAYGATDPIFADGYGTILCFLRIGDRVFLTNEVTDRGVEAIMVPLKLMDLSVYGRKEPWEDAPEGWPKQPQAYWFWRKDGRPVPQWGRPGATSVTGHD
ncbi:MAG: DUF899 domain-containing protein [Thermomicrobiales bacterium]|nr:DUF899 domain-containing protein [Thermomicrobiales bacterium]